VRELENAVEHAVAVSEGPLLGAHELPASVRSPRLLSPRAGVDVEPAEREAPPFAGRARASGRDPDARSLDDVTREHVLRALALHGGNATAAAKQLGVSRTTLWRMLKRWGVSRSATRGS
jgi:DNA-binding NtrC family response regulator